MSLLRIICTDRHLGLRDVPRVTSAMHAEVKFAGQMRYDEPASTCDLAANPHHNAPPGRGNHAIPRGASVNSWQPSEGRPGLRPSPGQLPHVPWIHFKASWRGQLRSMRARIIFASSWRDRASTSLPTFSRTMA